MGTRKVGKELVRKGFGFKLTPMASCPPILSLVAEKLLLLSEAAIYVNRQPVKLTDYSRPQYNRRGGVTPPLQCGTA